MPKALKILILLLATVTIGIYASNIPQIKAKITPPKNEVEITKPQKPSAQIAQTDLQITKEGQVVKGQNSSLPTLYIPGDLKIEEGQKVEDKNIIFAASVADLVAKTDFHPASIRLLSKDEIALYETDQTVAIFSSRKSPDQQVDSLQQVLAASKIEGTKLAKIDLRFDKPTVTFK